MAMSKKDYVLIAGVLNRMRQDVSADTTGALDTHERHLVVATIDQLGDDLGRTFAAASATFKPETFRAAVRKEG